jgi:small subunit ribosomal protein S1
MVDMMMGEEGLNNEEASGSPMWEFLKEEYDYKRPKRGDIRYAEVLRIDKDEIIVDIGGKTEGVVPSADLDRMGDEALSEIEVGDKVPVYVLRPESADGDVIVSLNMARTMEDWRKAERLFEEGGVHEGTVAGYNKGGLLVYFGQIRGFVPASQLSGLSRRSSHEDRMGTLSKMEGQPLLLKVIEVDRQRRRLIFSERAASREWREKRKDELLNELQEGDIRPGTVRNLCEFGAFVDLGGADGLIHISELSWRRVKHAREVLRVGADVEVYVLRVDRERKRIGLSLKRLQPDPWHVAEESYEVGQVVKGVVTNIVDFGAFARIEDGIEGLIHVSELSDGDFAPRDLVREGEQLYVKILSIDANRQRMGLSLKQAPSREEVEGDDAWAHLREEVEEGAPEASLAEAEEAVAEAEEALEGELEVEEALSEVEEGAPEAFLAEAEEAVAEAEEALEGELEVEEALSEVEEGAPEASLAEAEEAVAEAEEALEGELEVEEALSEVEEGAPEASVAEAEEAVAEAEEALEGELEVEEALSEVEVVEPLEESDLLAPTAEVEEPAAEFEPEEPEVAEAEEIEAEAEAVVALEEADEAISAAEDEVEEEPAAEVEETEPEAEVEPEEPEASATEIGVDEEEAELEAEGEEEAEPAHELEAAPEDNPEVEEEPAGLSVEGESEPDADPDEMSEDDDA